MSEIILCSLLQFSLSIVFKRHPFCSISAFYCWIIQSVHTLHLSFHHLMGIGVVPTCWLLSIMLLWIFVHEFFCGYIFFISLRHICWNRIWGHMVTIFLRNCQTGSFKVAAFLSTLKKGSNFSTPLQTCYYSFLKTKFLFIFGCTGPLLSLTSLLSLGE